MYLCNLPQNGSYQGLDLCNFPYSNVEFIFFHIQLSSLQTTIALQTLQWFEAQIKDEGPTEIWTRIAGFKVQSANHYTMEPLTL